MLINYSLLSSNCSNKIMLIATVVATAYKAFDSQALSLKHLMLSLMLINFGMQTPLYSISIIIGQRYHSNYGFKHFQTIRMKNKVNYISNHISRKIYFPLKISLNVFSSTEVNKFSDYQIGIYIILQLNF